MKLEKDIAVWENCFRAEDCQVLIDYFHTIKECKLTYTRLDLREAPSHKKNDEAVFVLDPDTMRAMPNEKLVVPFMQKFWNCYRQYMDHYSVLLETGDHQVRSMKIQKTLPGQGYHMWHFESDSIDRSARVCSWAIFLNTVDTGGETEFLYQSVRVPAKQGTLMIWPAGFPHTHRGNPPLSGEKYIMTGWIEF